MWWPAAVWKIYRYDSLGEINTAAKIIKEWYHTEKKWYFYHFFTRHFTPQTRPGTYSARASGPSVACHGHVVTAREPPWSSATAHGHMDLLMVQSAVNRGWYSAITRGGRTLLDMTLQIRQAQRHDSKLR